MTATRPKKFCAVVKIDARHAPSGNDIWVLTLACGTVVERTRYNVRNHRSTAAPTRVACDHRAGANP